MMRSLPLLLLVFFAISIASAQQPAIADPSHPALPLWSSGAPGAIGTAEEDTPTLAAYLPTQNPTHSAVIVAPGGGYAHLAMDKEGYKIAEWFNAHGVAAFVLKYRLGPKYHHPIEMEDAQRAIRTVRANAARYGIAEEHIGMMGFSAGGHLASTVGTHFDAGVVTSNDAIEHASSRPDFLILCYPVITLRAEAAHAGSGKYLLGDKPDPALITLLSNEEQVTSQTPPTFLWSTTDDGTVPVMNSVQFYSALVKNKVPAEIHIFRHGSHGLGLAQSSPDVSIWPELMLHWMVANGWAQ